MAILQFEATLDENNVIHVPAEIAAQLKQGEKVNVTVAPAELSKEERDKIWQSILDTMDAHIAQGPTPDGRPYQWNRDELYDHLEKYYDQNRTD